MGPGKEQYNLPELGAEGSQASPGQRESPPQLEPALWASSPILPAPSVTGASSPSVPAHQPSPLTHTPPPGGHSKPFRSSPHSSCSQRCPASAQVLLRTPVQGAASTWTPHLLSSWGPPQTAHPILNAAGPQVPAVAPTSHLACSSHQFPRVWAEPRPEQTRANAADPPRWLHPGPPLRAGLLHGEQLPPSISFNTAALSSGPQGLQSFPRVSVVGWGVLDTQVEPEVIVGLPRSRSPPGVCPVSPGQQACSVLAGPLHLSHHPNSQNTSQVPLREGQAA